MLKETVLKYTRSGMKTSKRHLSHLYLLEWIKNNCKINTVTIETNLRMEHIGDFYGLLITLRTNRKLQYINLLLNNLNSSLEYDGLSPTIYIVDELDSNIATIMEKLNNI